eukprot:GEMP01024796.1.p1 GENE.GEMP01024796.1~~GEMP01024796.1.p1  ORF type:complete len:349 (+),score=65.56 GEMP01024796.1:162-1208(+)
MAISAECDRSIVWAKLSLISDVKVPAAPLPPAIIAIITNVMFKEETAQAFHNLKAKNFAPEMQEAAIAIVHQVAPWHIPRLITEPIFKNREDKFMGSAEEFYLLCVYLLYRSHDAYYNAPLSPISHQKLHILSPTSTQHGGERPTSPLGDALKARESGIIRGIMTDDLWGISMSQEELDIYMQSCESTEVEPESPMSTQLIRRKKIMSQHEGRELRQDDEWTVDTVDLGEKGSESPMSKALRCRNHMFMRIDDDDDNNDDHDSDSSPMSTNLLKRKKEMSLWGRGPNTHMDPEFFLARADGTNDDETIGSPSPMTRALESKSRSHAISHTTHGDEGPTMIDLLMQGKI